MKKLWYFAPSGSIFSLLALILSKATWSFRLPVLFFGFLDPLQSPLPILNRSEHTNSTKTEQVNMADLKESVLECSRVLLKWLFCYFHQLSTVQSRACSTCISPCLALAQLPMRRQLHRTKATSLHQSQPDFLSPSNACVLPPVIWNDESHENNVPIENLSSLNCTSQVSRVCVTLSGNFTDLFYNKRR